MKMLLTAVAMLIASPALAQSAPVTANAGHAASGHVGPSGQSKAPAPDPHAGHDMSGGMMDCCKKGADGAMACCAKMKAAGKAMPCCDKMKADGTKASAAAAPDPHAGHKMPTQ